LGVNCIGRAKMEIIPKRQIIITPTSTVTGFLIAKLIKAIAVSCQGSGIGVQGSDKVKALNP
ncbi:MAG TPA: hypothetical protein QF468_10565, partial [Nitrospinota bacterium]|nr:hypothetical protein [Nitrospinota bacterium]